MDTKKLYYQNPYLNSFDTQMVEKTKISEAWHIVLEETAFFPGGGGQPADKGVIDGVTVQSVYEQDGVIYHVLPTEPHSETVSGVINWDYRFEQMQQHLGQHILSAIFVEHFHADTIGLRFLPEGFYIDINKNVPLLDCEKAEALANGIIYQNIPIQILYPSDKELRSKSRRPIPKSNEPIRIVKIGDLDYTPCSGLHPVTSGEVNMIKVIRTEIVKGVQRVHAIAGQSAILKLNRAWETVKNLSKMFSVYENEVLEHIEKQQSDLLLLREELERYITETMRERAEENFKNAIQVGEREVVVSILMNTSREAMQKLITILLAKPSTVVLLGGYTENGAALMFGCNKQEKALDLRPVFQNALQMIQGKGGGSKVFVQGSGCNTQQLEQAIEYAKKEVLGLCQSEGIE